MDAAAALRAFLTALPDMALLAGAAGAVICLALVLALALRGGGRRRLAARIEQLAGERLDADDRLADRIDAALDRRGQATAASLAGLAERIGRIDAAQANLRQIAGQITGLERLLSDKQARGAFGEARLSDLLRDALPPDAYKEQATLPNGRRVDALLLLPAPPGPIAVDSKFPLEQYRALIAAADANAERLAQRQFARDVAKHIADIAERYIVPGATADMALMFVPSEAVYAEIHGRAGAVVEEGFRRRVYLVSPTTLWATLNTARAILKDAHLHAESARLQEEALGLVEDVRALADKAESAQRRLVLAEADLSSLAIAARSAERRGRGIAALDLDRPDSGLIP